jgi:N-methylhydantoinase A
MRRIVVPPHAGVLSALGLAMTPERRDAMASVMRRLEEWDDDERAEMTQSLAARLPAELRRRTLVLRMRYVGQGHELDVPAIARATTGVLGASFRKLHERRYSFTLDAPIEVVSMRMVAEGAGRSVSIGGRPAAKRAHGPASVALPDATLWIEKGWSGRALARGGFLLERR